MFVVIFHECQSLWCEVLSHCGFYLHSLMISDIKHFSWIFSHLNFLFEDVPVHLFSPFILKEVALFVCLFACSGRALPVHSLYILDANFL